MSYKHLPDVPLHVTSEDADFGVAGGRTTCTIAQCGAHAEGMKVRPEVVYSKRIGKVVCGWDIPIPLTDRFWHHTGIIEPLELAIQIMTVNDDDTLSLKARRKALHAILGDEGVFLTVTNHRAVKSHPPKERTQADRDRERNRKRELERLRAEGLIPPAKKRKPYARTGTVRFRAVKGT